MYGNELYPVPCIIATTSIGRHFPVRTIKAEPFVSFLVYKDDSTRSCRTLHHTQGPVCPGPQRPWFGAGATKLRPALLSEPSFMGVWGEHSVSPHSGQGMPPQLDSLREYCTFTFTSALRWRRDYPLGRKLTAMKGQEWFRKRLFSCKLLQNTICSCPFASASGKYIFYIADMFIADVCVTFTSCIFVKTKLLDHLYINVRSSVAASSGIMQS